MTPAAVYNHFADKDELLYAAGRLAIDRLNASMAPAGDTAEAARSVVEEFLRPSFAADPASHPRTPPRRRPPPRARRAPRGVARRVRRSRHRAFSRRSGAATLQVKALFLLLLGCCHLDDLDSLETAPAEFSEHVGRLVDALYRRAPE